MGSGGGGGGGVTNVPASFRGGTESTGFVAPSGDGTEFVTEEDVGAGSGTFCSPVPGSALPPHAVATAPAATIRNAIFCVVPIRRGARGGAGAPRTWLGTSAPQNGQLVSLTRTCLRQV